MDNNHLKHDIPLIDYDSGAGGNEVVLVCHVSRRGMSNMIIRHASPSQHFFDHRSNIRKVRGVVEYGDAVSDDSIELLVCLRHGFWKSDQTENEAVHG